MDRREPWPAFMMAHALSAFSAQARRLYTMIDD